MLFKALIIGIIVIGFEFIISCSQKTDDRTLIQQTNGYSTSSADTCDNPDADVNCCFINLTDSLTSIMTIAGENESGEKIILKGKIIYAESKQPVTGAILYSYHTDNTGHHPKTGSETGVQKWHGKLHGWCKTDSTGNFEIRTIRPVPEPSANIPAHIHMAIRLRDGSSFWLNDFLFSDDPLVTKSYLESMPNLHNPKELDNGVITLIEISSGVKQGERNIYIIK